MSQGLQELCAALYGGLLQWHHLSQAGQYEQLCVCIYHGNADFFLLYGFLLFEDFYEHISYCNLSLNHLIIMKVIILVAEELKVGMDPEEKCEVKNLTCVTFPTKKQCRGIGVGGCVCKCSYTLF